jgi:hypothetical protein
MWAARALRAVGAPPAVQGGRAVLSMASLTLCGLGVSPALSRLSHSGVCARSCSSATESVSRIPSAFHSIPSPMSNSNSSSSSSSSSTSLLPSTLWSTSMSPVGLGCLSGIHGFGSSCNVQSQSSRIIMNTIISSATPGAANVGLALEGGSSGSSTGFWTSSFSCQSQQRRTTVSFTPLKIRPFGVRCSRTFRKTQISIRKKRVSVRAFETHLRVSPVISIL